MNAFQSLVNITENKWYDILDFSLMIGFQLKLAGIDWRTNEELLKMINECMKIGFMEYDKANPRKVKIKDEWYAYKSEYK